MNENTDTNNPRTDVNPAFEQALVNQIAKEFLTEQRRTRRWGIFFKLLVALYLFSFLFIYMAGSWDMENMATGDHTALIDISGVIAADAQASADNIVTGLRAAFKDKNTVGLILRINSPGGSPVQAGYINDEIQRLRQKNPEIPVYAVISDMCASGGYYIASAADKIYADKASLLGSIGVIMSGFGYVDAMEKLGVERRLLHAGDSKGFLDSFSPLKETDVAHVDTLLDDIYQQFIDTVKQGRGDRLKEDDKIFSGLIWTGEQSIELGLVDALGSSSYVAREVIGAEDIVNYTYRQSYLDRLIQGVSAELSERLFGLVNYELKQ